MGEFKSEVSEVPPPEPEKTTKFCSECGAEISTKAEICPKCGVRQVPAIYREPKSKGVAVVLAIFLGGLGIHKFYLGRPKMGIIYLLLCWTFIPAIIAFIEGLQMAFTSDESFHKQYG